MPANEPKTPKPEDIFNEVVNSFLKGFSGPTSTNEEPVVDSVKEAHRLLKKAEESADNATPTYTHELLEIADRHIRIIDLALSSQR